LPYEELEEWESFAVEMMQWIAVHGCHGMMPSRVDLIQSGRNDLRYAIYSHGGNVKVARRLELVSLDEPGWISKWLAVQAARLGVYLSLSQEKRSLWTQLTGEEQLPRTIRGGRAALDAANLLARRRQILGAGRDRRGSGPYISLPRRKGTLAQDLDSGARTADSVLSNAELEGLRERFAHLDADDIIVP
jgi:hypothetical protein